MRVVIFVLYISSNFKEIIKKKSSFNWFSDSVVLEIAEVELFKVGKDLVYLLVLFMLIHFASTC